MGRLIVSSSTAETVTYENTNSGLTGTTVQEALDELASGTSSAPTDFSIPKDLIITNDSNFTLLLDSVAIIFQSIDALGLSVIGSINVNQDGSVDVNSNTTATVLGV
jgi:hypothetical protein